MAEAGIVRLTLSLGVGQTLAFASSYYLLGGLGEALALELQLKASLVMGLMSLALLAAAVSASLAGRWIDASGGRVPLMASSLIFALALFIIGTSHGLVQLALGVAVLGVGMSVGLSATAFAILVDHLGEAARRPITAVALIGGLGSTLGWPVTHALVESFNWRIACFVWAGMHLGVCLPLIAFAAPRRPKRGPSARKVQGPPITWDRSMVKLAVLFACAWLVSSCMGAHLPRLLVGLGQSPEHAARTAALVGVAAVSARLAELTVLKQLKPLTSTRIATLMHPLGAMIALFMGPAAAAAMALGQGAGNGVLTVAKGTLPLQIFGRDNYAYRSALLTRPAQIAQIAGPILYGAAIDHSPRFALAISSGLCLIMFFMTFGLGERANHGPEGA